MTEIIIEWINKSEEDWQVVCLLSDSDLEAYNTICFHAQQCAEKLLKALLIYHQIVPEYTHNLVRLRQKLSNYYSDWNVTLDELELLSAASITVDPAVAVTVYRTSQIQRYWSRS
jgi:HEPN domain-containing protein